jgi:molecular chaperone GrpE
MTEQRKGDPIPVKVVDRRWWARGHDEGPVEDASSLKPSYVQQLEQQIAEKDRLLQEHAVKFREAAAEFDQARTRARREVSREVERGRRTFILELLDVLDNLDRAIDAAREAAGRPEGDSLLQGVEMVRDQFLARLEGFGVTRIESLDRPFDPRQHEAVTTVPAATPEQDGLVVGVIRHGYAIGEEVLRPATVAVAQAGTLVGPDPAQN